jgi:hypothetical protein
LSSSENKLLRVSVQFFLGHLNTATVQLLPSSVEGKASASKIIQQESVSAKLLIKTFADQNAKS